MFRPDRAPRGEDPMLLAKMIIFVIAAIVAIAGMVMNQPWVIFFAIIILGIGFLLRFIRVPGRREDEPGEGK
jgi:hypothetical protein